MENNLLKTNDEQSLGGLYFSITIILLLVANIVLSVVLSLIGNLENIQGTLWYTAISFSLSGIVIIASTLLFSKINGVKIGEFCGLKRAKAKYYLLAIATFVAIFFGLSSINLKFVEFLQNFGYKYEPVVLPRFSPINFIVVVIVACVLPAITEEIALRSIVLNGVKTGSVVLNATIGGLLFSIYHMNPAQTPYQFVIGFVFSIIAIKSRSVIPTVIAHFLNNFAVICIEYFCPGFTVWGSSFASLIIGLSLVCLISVIVLLIADKGNGEKQEKSGVKRFFAYASLGIAVCILMWISALLV